MSAMRKPGGLAPHNGLTARRDGQRSTTGDLTVKTINSIKLTDDQLRQIVAPSDGPTKGDKAVMMSVAVFFVWILADMIGGWL
jgi:hypothetical protein